MTAVTFPAPAAGMGLSGNDIPELLDEAFAIGLMQLREEIFALCAWLRCKPIRNVLEIGTGHGGTFYLWCKLFPGGLKVSLDLAGGPYGGEPNADPAVLAERNRRMLTWSPSAHVVSGDSRDPRTREMVDRILGKEKLDLLFIDGNHTYDAVNQDFHNFRAMVAPGGVVIFHDINDSEFHRANDVGVARLWSEIAGKKLEISCRDTWGGIGIWRED
jgi:predicted O-methyltransferase YrrM